MYNTKNAITEHRFLAVLVITSVLGLALTACAGAAASQLVITPTSKPAAASDTGAAPASALTPTEVVTVDMTDFAFKFTPSTIKAGVVKFVAKNDSPSVMHEIFLVKTDLAVDKLPIASDGSSVNEDSNLITKLGSVEDVDAGKSGEMTIKLEPGHYVYFCNKPGHYKMGMAGDMTVVP
ncbi:MAG TPA: plastocyanin/azurin family copper-binding protein [Anaerolineae bacterium]